MSRRIYLLALACLPAFAGNSWTVAQDEHFQVYSQAGADTARAALHWFEQLRLFFARQTGLTLENKPAVRVIGFKTGKEYDAYRLRETSDAYSVSSEGEDYIVMAGLEPANYSIAAHEYVHVILHASGLRPPPWLQEGLAEFFSTVRISERGSTLGGDRPAHSQSLRRELWIPLPHVVSMQADAPERNNRDRAGMFYSQSWALTEMLFQSPDYGPGFAALLSALVTGASSQEAIQQVYSKSLDAVNRDLHTWVARRSGLAVSFPGVSLAPGAVQTSEVPELESRFLLAGLVAAMGDLARAASLYRELAAEHPERADAFAALGAIGLRRGNYEEARREWKRAIALGIADATLCYRYAVLASLAGIPADEIRPALQRAVSLNPDLDDARYQLALLEKNTDHYEAALEQMLALRGVPPARAFGYWSALADLYNSLDRREEAKAAAAQALEHAATAGERERAGYQAFVARTDLTVQFTRDPDGQAHMVTTRVPHGTTDWNPFIEQGDDVRHVEGLLREIDCSGSKTRMLVDTGHGRVWLEIADPSRVQMRKAPPELTCGVQKPASAVVVDYAKTAGDGIVRGMEFR